MAGRNSRVIDPRRFQRGGSHNTSATKPRHKTGSRRPRTGEGFTPSESDLAMDALIAQELSRPDYSDGEGSMYDGEVNDIVEDALFGEGGGLEIRSGLAELKARVAENRNKATSRLNSVPLEAVNVDEAMAELKSATEEEEEELIELMKDGFDPMNDSWSDEDFDPSEDETEVEDTSDIAEAVPQGRGYSTAAITEFIFVGLKAEAQQIASEYFLLCGNTNVVTRVSDGVPETILDIETPFVGDPIVDMALSIWANTVFNNLNMYITGQIDSKEFNEQTHFINKKLNKLLVG